jgi:regulator of protease activity HflC (stomatin/prohibitin superfamily)
MPALSGMSTFRTLAAHARSYRHSWAARVSLVLSAGAIAPWQFGWREEARGEAEAILLRAKRYRQQAVAEAAGQSDAL